MTNKNIYKDIAARTGGEIHIGVVGPVRTGKSTFIKRFMDTLVIPAIGDEYARNRTTDELPQSASGKTVMTTEPKFIPAEAVPLTLAENASMRVRMIDCVGYVVPGAMGLTEDGEPRMVMTPWSGEPMPFGEAAEIGTRKVIGEHATIGILVTTDGTISDIPREDYVAAEQRVVSELKEKGKPFVIVLNSASPGSEESVSLAASLEKAYGVPVALVSCLALDEQDIRKILEMVLLEFPVTELRFDVPRWFASLAAEHPLRDGILAELKARVAGIEKVGQVHDAFVDLPENDYRSSVELLEVDLSTGSSRLAVRVPDDTFYAVLREQTGFEIDGSESLMTLLTSLAAMKKQYDKLEPALKQAEETGYGIVMPGVEDMELREPEIVRQVGGYGVKLRASAPSLHLIKADVEAEVCPVVGSEKQSEDVVKYLLGGFEENPASIWESNIFGTSLHELMNEGLGAKLAHMPYDARMKLADTLRKIINEGSNGLICVLL